MPLEHSTIGRPQRGARSSTERMCCAGVTTSQASQPSRSARSLVAEIDGRQRDFGKEDGVAMLGVDRDHDLLFQRPQQSVAAVRSNRLGQRGAPGAAADHREALDLHALTPAPRTFSALSSSGQRARAGASSGSVMPGGEPLGAGPGDHRRIVGAQPGGRDAEAAAFCRGEPCQAPCGSRWLAATPPATTSAGASVLPSASLVRSTRQSTTACWKLAAMSSRR